MRSKFKWIFTLLLALTMQFSFAQERTISGVVSDASGPLPSANVVVKGSGASTVTDIDGTYSIQAKTGDVLVFSFTGMTDQSITVTASNTIDVTLAEGITLIEVIVDGYKSTTKKKSANAVTTVTAEAVEGRPNVSFLQSLQSQVAGLNIATSSGTPGTAKIDVVLRGYSSVLGSTEPLYVIDGVVSNSVVFRALNSEDIASISVLKDAGATAIYGNRGANGVIVITTKKGKFNSKLSVRYNGSTGFSQLQQNKYDFLTSQQQLALEVQRQEGYGFEVLGISTPEQAAAFPFTTDWTDVFFQTGVTRSHNISLQQGGENMTNFTSFSYFDQDGIVPTTYFKRFTFRTNFAGKSSNEKFNYSTNFTGSFSKRSQLNQETNSDLNANVVQNPLQGAIASMPYIDPNLYINGQDVWDNHSANLTEQGPYSLLDYIQPGNIPNEYSEIKLILNASGTYNFTDALSFTSTGGIDFNESRRLFARAPQSFLAIAVASTNGSEFGGIEDMGLTRDFGFTFTNKLTYNKTFKEKHTIDVSLFTEYNKYHIASQAQRQDGLDPRTWAFGAGTGYIAYDPVNDFYRPTISASKAEGGLFSYFMTADYDFDAKYGVQATIRRDASYRFVEDNRWGTFYSISARWNIDQESFMQNSDFGMLKLRASYGTTGNQNILTPAYGQNPIYLANNLTRDLSDTGQGYNGNPSAFFPSQFANVGLRWETTNQFNVGVDWTWRQRFSGTLDFYRKETEDLFDTDYVSSINGVTAIAANTQGTLLNTGVELQLSYDVVNKGDFRLKVFGNASYNKNEREGLVYFPGEDLVFEGNISQQNGRPLNAYYLVPYLGVNPENGNLLFLGSDGLPTETPDDEDRRFVDKNYFPAYQGGFGLNASYLGVFVDANFSFIADVAKFDFDLANMSAPDIFGEFPMTTDVLDAWTDTNTDGSFPSLDATNAQFDGISDRFLRDASYIRLKNLVVGYDVPKKFLDKTFFESVRVFTQMENILTFSSWRGFDVENGNPSNQGGYPAPKVVSFGVDVSF